MFVFRKARNPAKTLNDLNEYLNGLNDEPAKWLAREVQSWGEFDYAELEAAILDGRLNDLIDWQARYAQVVNDVLRPQWAKAIEAASKKTTRGKTILSDSDDYVKAWLATHGAELATRLSDESKKAIANVLLKWQAELLRPKKIAQQIRPLIGLNERQALANVNYRAKLYQKLLDNGVKPSAAAERADKAAVRYASKQQRYRAETIVNTELAFAYNRGAHMGVSQSIADGYMGRCEMIWTTAGTNRVCGRCMELKDKSVGFTDEVGVQLPPLHPRCRCAIIYREVGKPVGVPNWRRQEHFSTSDENIQATNPNYNLGRAFQINCQKCVPTYEMRMRGYDVTARPTFDVDTDGFAQEHWSSAFENPKVESAFQGSGKAEVVARMKSFGDGARAEVYVDWAEESFAHVFVAENRNGTIHFLDPQSGELDVEHYFEHVKDGLTKLLRMDNLEPNEKNIKWCCKEVKRNVNSKRSDRTG